MLAWREIWNSGKGSARVSRERGWVLKFLGWMDGSYVELVSGRCFLDPEEQVPNEVLPCN